MLAWLSRLFGPKTRTVNGVLVDHVWLDPASQDEPGALEIQRNQYVQKSGFMFWTPVYHGLYIPMFFVPLVTAGLAFTGTPSATLGILCLIETGIVGLVYHLKPEAEAMNYQSAVNINQKARVAYENGHKPWAHRLLQLAIDLATPRTASETPPAEN